MIRIGTSGYSFRDWVGPFYPAGTHPGKMLEFYAKKFNVVEINATYYRVPPPRTFEGMARRTPDRFGFVVKTHKGMTHDRNCDTEGFRRLHDAVEPLREAGKLLGFVAQFPYGFKFSRGNLDYLIRLKENFSNEHFHVEFRNRTWLRESVFIALESSGIGFCMVDEPPLKGLLPPVARATTRVAYVRFHGRNKDDWWHPREGSDRYNYDYSNEELSEWVDPILKIEKKNDCVLLFFNNCHFGRAPRNAERMAALLGLDIPPDPGQAMLPF
ncbi:MAG: DUF72 domain-containing protein [bacterium]